MEENVKALQIISKLYGTEEWHSINAKIIKNNFLENQKGLDEGIGLFCSEEAGHRWHALTENKQLSKEEYEIEVSTLCN